jgi:hypothetical protein
MDELIVALWHDLQVRGNRVTRVQHTQHPPEHVSPPPAPQAFLTWKALDGELGDAGFRSHADIVAGLALAPGAAPCVWLCLCRVCPCRVPMRARTLCKRAVRRVPPTHAAACLLVCTHATRLASPRVLPPATLPQAPRTTRASRAARRRRLHRSPRPLPRVRPRLEGQRRVHVAATRPPLHASRPYATSPPSAQPSQPLATPASSSHFPRPTPPVPHLLAHPPGKRPWPTLLPHSAPGGAPTEARAVPAPPSLPPPPALPEIGALEWLRRGLLAERLHHEADALAAYQVASTCSLCSH